MKQVVYPIVTKTKPYLECSNCADVIISLYRHDFRTCSCYENELDNKGCFIDGGDIYTRTGFSREHMPISGTALFEIDYNKGTFKMVGENHVDEQNTSTISTDSLDDKPSYRLTV